MKIILLGYMGSGKSTIAKELAKRLGYDFIDLDDYITDKEHNITNEIFKIKGEIYFRKKENQYLKELLTLEKKMILAVGGGTPCYANNIGLIAKNSKSFYLKGSINTLYNRLIEEKDERPLIKEIRNDHLREFIAKHLFERSQFYEKADKIVIIDGKSIDDIVNEIMLDMQ